jgi:hypothetical protein
MIEAFLKEWAFALKKPAPRCFWRNYVKTDEAIGRTLDNNLEDLVAELTAVVYQVALRHGLKGPFIDVELTLWQALRAVVAAHLTQEGAHPARPSSAACPACGLLYLNPQQGEVRW